MGPEDVEDTLEDRSEEQREEQPLKEKDFIDEEYPKNPMKFWRWAAVFMAFVVLMWGMSNWWVGYFNEEVEGAPFLQVTNREMSLFLWQFPHLMRQNAKQKAGYLDGFDFSERVGIKEGEADKYIVATPELLFLYHTWNRLLKGEFVQRKIPREQYMQFLKANPEWLPENWPGSPELYKMLIKNQGMKSVENFADLSLEVLPLDARIAFQGWKNFYLEGEEINKTEVTYKDLNSFLQDHGNYRRNYWKNIVVSQFPKYLIGSWDGSGKADSQVPEDQLPAFVKVAVFNAMMAKEGK